MHKLVCICVYAHALGKIEIETFAILIKYNCLKISILTVFYNLRLNTVQTDCERNKKFRVFVALLKEEVWC